jgi:hypothetical protein
MRSILVALSIMLATAAAPLKAVAQDGQMWVASWVASAQGPYPIGNPSAQPDQKFAFPTPATGAREQTFRMVLRPDIWGKQARVRFTNVFGTKPLTIDGAFAGLQLGGPALAKGTNAPVTFAGKASVTIAAGQSVWSDTVNLRFAANPDAPLLSGRKLAVSFHVAGESGPMTWHVIHGPRVQPSTPVHYGTPEV